MSHTNRLPASHKTFSKSIYSMMTSPDVTPSVSSVPRHVRTRRKLWLSSHPSYFEEATHSLSLPLAYDRLIRRYQTSAERQSEGKARGWAGMLEGALLRGEAKRDAAVQSAEQEQERRRPRKTDGGDGGSASKQPQRKGLKPLPEELAQEKDGLGQSLFGRAGDRDISVQDLRDGLDDREASGAMNDKRWDIPLGVAPTDELLDSDETEAEEPEERHCRGPSIGEIELPLLEQADGGPVDGLDRQQAQGRWTELLTRRFVAGADEDFDYEVVDRAADHDEQQWSEDRRQEEWFDDEPESRGSSDDSGARTQLLGQTGIQDF